MRRGRRRRWKIMETQPVSVIVPTIGRPISLKALLESLVAQTVHVQEVIVADASGGDQILQIVCDSRWAVAGLPVHRIVVAPPNAVRQREEAIRVSQGRFLLLLDDDVVLEPSCVHHMLALINADPDVVGIFADFNNQPWPPPTRFWKFYMRHFLSISEGAWQGRVIGPLLRFGYNPPPALPAPMEWLGTCNSLISRAAYIRVGGFSNFFWHRCTINEDVDLGIKLSRVGKILFCPAARLAHNHDPIGRVALWEAAADDVYNRFFVLRRTMDKSCVAAFGLIWLFFVGETLSNLFGCLRRGRGGTAFIQRLYGRSRGLGMITLKAVSGFEKRNA